MAEAHAAGIPPHRFWDLTWRELHAVMAGERLKATRAHKMTLWGAWHQANFGRTPGKKRLLDLKQLLAKLDPIRVMSAKALRAAVIGMAHAMGAKVEYRRKD